MLTPELIIHKPAKLKLAFCENIEEGDIGIARRRLEIESEDVQTEPFTATGAML